MELENKLIVESLLRFSNEFYRHVNDQQAMENVWFSPLSLHVALTMALLGMDGNTKEELLKTLKFSQQLQNGNLAASVGAAQMSMLKPEGVEILMANKMFLDIQFVIKSTYEESLKLHFNSSTQRVDFKHKIDEARNIINEWVDKITNQMIPELLPENSIDEHTLMTLVNAIYFKGDWRVTFDKDYTEDREFYLLNGETIKVKMMRHTHCFEFADLSYMNAKAVKLPYKDSSWAMLIVLPNENNGLPDVLKHISQEAGLQKLFSTQFTKSVVELELPRFQLSGAKSINVRHVLELMGTKLAFGDQCDFSKLTDQLMSISKIIHQAVLEVDEHGTKAAAATALIVRLRGGPSSEIKCFRVNHPFLLTIVCDDMVPVFLGHVIKPEGLSSDQ